MKKLLLSFTCFFLFIKTFAQTKIRIEKIECISSCSNTFSYLDNTSIQGQFISAIKNEASKMKNLAFETDYFPDFTNKKIENGFIENRKFNTTIENADFNGWYLFIQMIENAPLYLSKLLGASEETSMLSNNAQSIMEIKMCVKNANGEVLLNKQSYFIVNNSKAIGLGFPDYQYSMSANSLIEVIGITTKLFFTKSEELEPFNIVHCSPAFFTDNFIMPNVQGKKKYISEIKKQFVTIADNQLNPQLLRIDSAIIYQINWKKYKYSNEAKQVNAIKNHLKNNSNFDYCFMEQEFRNVNDNKNYSSKIYLAFNNNYENPSERVVFWEDTIHYFFSEKDTLATFAIKQNTVLSDKLIYLNTSYNGIDSNFQFKKTNKIESQSMLYNAVINGRIKGEDFKIHSSVNNTLKEIFYKNELICIAKGSKTPQVLVHLNNTISSETFQQLLLIAFIDLPNSFSN